MTTAKPTAKPSKPKKRGAPTRRALAPEILEARGRAADAMRLRVQGFSFSDIADRLGYNSTQAAYDAVKRALDRTEREPADALRTLESERLDQLWQRAYLLALNGDLAAAATAMKIMERRAKLLGLDAPAKTELSGANGVPLTPPVFNISFGDGAPGDDLPVPVDTSTPGQTEAGQAGQEEG